MKTNHLKFSLFSNPAKGLETVIPKREIDLPELFRVLQSPKLRELTENIRAATCDKTKKELKNRLPFITTYGTFPYRKNEQITHYNKDVIAFDFDDITPSEIDAIKKCLINSRRAYYVGISPRGNGLKALVKISHDFAPSNHYPSAKFHTKTIFKMCHLDENPPGFDLRQFVLSQPLLLSFDETAYFNLDPDPIPFDDETDNILRPFNEELPIYSKIIDAKKLDPKTKEKIKRVLSGKFAELTNLYLDATEKRHDLIKRVTSFASDIREYLPEREQYYYSCIKTAIITMYGGERDAQNHNAIRSFNCAWDDKNNKPNTIIERLILEVERQKTVIESLQNCIEFESSNGDESNPIIDLIETTPNGAKWKVNGYDLCYFNRNKNTFGIEIKGIPTASKIERLELLPGIELKQIDKKKEFLLNGALWKGEFIEVSNELNLIP